MSNQFTEWMNKEPLFLDTETTGLGADAEICEIAIIDHEGAVIVDSLVKPVAPIPPDAGRIHGITDKMVADAPTIDEIMKGIDGLVKDKLVLIRTYNADYDTRLISQSLKFRNVDLSGGILSGIMRLIRFRNVDSSNGILSGIETGCVMQLFAERYGKWSDYHKSYTWVKLIKAAYMMDIDPDAVAKQIGSSVHRARVDAELTRRVVLAVAGVEGNEA